MVRGLLPELADAPLSRGIPRTVPWSAAAPTYVVALAPLPDDLAVGLPRQPGAAMEQQQGQVGDVRLNGSPARASLSAFCQLSNSTARGCRAVIGKAEDGS